MEKNWIGWPDEGEYSKYNKKKESWADRLNEAGIDPRKDIHYLIAGIEAGDKGLVTSAILVGQFDPERVLKTLNKSYSFTTEKWGDYSLLNYHPFDSNSCKAGDPKSIWISKNYIVWSTPENLKSILIRIFDEKAPAIDKTKWDSYRNHKLMAAMLRVPKQELKPSNIVEAIGTKAVSKSFAPFDFLFLGLDIQWAQFAGLLNLQIDYRDSKEAKETVDKWKASLADSKARWREDMPSLSQLMNAVVIKDGNKELKVDVRIDKAGGELLKKIPGEFLKSLFSGFGFSNESAKVQNSVEEFDDKPSKIQLNVDVPQLPKFDPKGTFWGKSLPYEFGPVGFQIETVKFKKNQSVNLKRAENTAGTNNRTDVAGPSGTNKSESSAKEMSDDLDLNQEVMTIEYFGVGIPNLDSSDLVSIYFNEALDQRGQNQLEVKSCGNKFKIEPSHPSQFTEYNGLPSFRGSSDLTFKPGFEVQQISEIKGEIKIRVPTKINVVELENKNGEKIETDQVAIVIDKSDESTLRAKIYGDSSLILSMNGLNKDHKKLRSDGNWSSGFFYGDGVLKSYSFKGKVKKAQFYIASEIKDFAVPFIIKPTLPLVTPFQDQARNEVLSFTKIFESFTRKDLESKFAKNVKGSLLWNPLSPGVEQLIKNNSWEFKKDNASESEKSYKTLSAGPFTVLWNPFKTKDSLFYVLANALPNSAYSESLEVKLTEILTKDGKIHTPPTVPVPENMRWNTRPWNKKGEMIVSGYRFDSQTNKFLEYTEPQRRLSLSEWDLPDKLKGNEVKKIKAVLRYRLVPEMLQLTVENLKLGEVVKDGETIQLRIVEVNRNSYIIDANRHLGSMLGVQVFDKSGNELQREKADFRDGKIHVPNKKGAAKFIFYFATKEDFVEYPIEIEYN